MKIKNIIRDLLYKLGLFNIVKKIILLYKVPHVKYKAQKYVKPVLCKTYKALEGNVEQFWIDHGTLLGYARNGKVLKGDYDLDIGVISLNNQPIQQFMEKQGFALSKRVIVEDIISFEQYRYKGFQFDIFYYRKEEEYFVTYFWIPIDYTMPQYISYKKGRNILRRIYFKPFRTKPIKFYECDYYAPEDYDYYLAYHYGQDYMIPNPNFTMDDELNSAVVDRDYTVEFYE